MRRLDVPGLERVRDRVRRYLLRAWRLEGVERHGGAPLTMCYAGTGLGRHYLCHLAFGDMPRITPLGRTWLWRAPELAAGTGAGLSFIETDAAGFERFAADGDWLVPCWVDGDITHARMTASMRRNRSVKHDVRRIHRQGFAFQVTTSVPMLEHFYDRMYRPYITNMHGPRAAYMSREAMIAKAEQVQLALIMRDGEAVAGGLLLYEEGGVRSWSIGVLDGNRHHVSEGAVAALYYSQMNHLASLGYEVCSAGASRAFLRDGVLQFKRKWGMALTRPRVGGFWLRHRADCEGARSFLVHNPFIHRRGDRLYALGFAAGGAPLGEAVERFSRLHDGLGVDGWAVAPVRPHADRSGVVACGVATGRVGSAGAVRTAVT